LQQGGHIVDGQEFVERLRRALAVGAPAVVQIGMRLSLSKATAIMPTLE
jgi:hypothetical protein